MPEQVDRNDARIAAVASRQHGVITIRQLLETGLSDDQVLERRRKGRLHRLYRGVYAVGHTAPSDRARWMAAVLAASFGRAPEGIPRRTDPSAAAAPTLDREAGVLSIAAIPNLHPAHAFLSHRSAAELWGLLPVRSGPVDVSITTRGGRARRAGIRLHRSTTLGPGETTGHDGIPVTTPARTIADLKGAIAEDARRRAIRQAEFLRLNLGPDIETDRTRSELERLFLRLCHRHQLPPPEVNVRVGRFTVDFLWRDAGLIVETDGFRSHSGREAFEGDRVRDLELRRQGYEVLRLSFRQVTTESPRVASVLRHSLS